ncbi:Disulfide isomerase-like protein [Dorcoceras hygrometricum]|uniref:Disulfide isomerase-like protein n=1 Tax=Dorcoceras hygrometricum TaxID=472368 RepID=A0A2Z7BI33_9LAMI|nr:Disulfide isomerase-like protein [Dorcoceras hygrometricum]
MMPSPSAINFPLFSLNGLVLMLLLLPHSSIRATEYEFKLDGKVLELHDCNFDATISVFDMYLYENVGLQLDKAAPLLAGLKKPIVVAKIDAEKYTSLASKHDIEEFIHAAGCSFHISIVGLNESIISNLAIKYKKRAWFSVAKDFSDDIMTKFDIDKTPALAAIHLVSDEYSIFDGPLEEKLLKNYIKQKFFPLVLPVNEEAKKFVVTIWSDEGDEKSKGLIKVLRWEDFAESFDVSKKTKLPKMVLWNCNEEYYMVICSESIDETDMGNQVSRFLEGYRKGRVLKKRYNGSVLMDFINSQLGGRYVLILIFVVLAMVLIRSTDMEEPMRGGIRDQVDAVRRSTVRQK